MSPSPRPARLMLAALILAGCAAEAGPCPGCAAPVRQGALAEPRLDETSGLAASAVFPDVIYAHNDAGDGSRFFALSRTGAALGVFQVKRAQNIDWEDMDRGPCPAGSCLFIADIGDNERIRRSYTLYRMTEPTVIASKQSIAAERFAFTYPDGAHDAETLLVHPLTGELTIVTKDRAELAQIFTLPAALTADETVMAAPAGELSPPSGDPEFTGGSIHPDATGIVMRTGSSLFYYPMQPEQSAAEALTGEPCALPVADEPNGEAVTWLASGAEILTVGEGVGAELHISSCAAD